MTGLSASGHSLAARLYGGQATSFYQPGGYSDVPDDSSPTIFTQLPGSEWAVGGSISTFHSDGPRPAGL